MNILILLAHPKPGSFNHAIAETVSSTLSALGHEVTLRDLCAEGFDPIYTAAELERGNTASPDIREHVEQVLAADGVIVIHPNWWGQPPAILKGWLDRVLRPGETYRFGSNEKGEGVIIPLLKLRAALVLTSSNTPREVEVAHYGDPLDGFWKKVVWGFFSVPRIERRNFESVIVSTPAQREQWLAEAKGLTESIFPADQA